MANETEQLTVVVNVDDQATAKLSRIRREFDQLTLGQSERFKRESSALNSQVKQLTDSVLQGERAMLGFVGRLGAVGLAMTTLVSGMRSFASSMGEIVRMGQLLGVPASNIKNVIDQFKQIGVSAEDSKSMISAFTQRLVELGRYGSQARQQLLNAAGPFQQNMEAYIQRLTQAKTLEEQFSIAHEEGAKVRQNRFEQALRQGMNREQATRDAAEVEERFYRLQNLRGDLMVRLTGQFKTMSDEEKRIKEESIRQGDMMEKKWREIESAIDKAGKQLQSSFGPAANAILDKIPGQIQAITNAITGMKKSGEDMAKARDEGRWYDFFGGKEGKGGLGALPGTLTPAPPKMQHGGIVRSPTMAMIGEAGPEAVIPLGGIGGIGGADKKSQLLEENTDELKKLNEKLDDIFGRGLGGLPGMGGGGLGGFHGGAGGGPGSTTGPGTGSGAGDTPPQGPTGAAPQEPSALSGAPGGLGLGGLKSHGVLGDANAGLFGTGSMGVLGPKGGTAPGGGGGGGGGQFASVGDLKGTGPHGTLNPDQLYKTLYNNVPNNLIGHVPKDGAKFGITTGSREEWAKLQYKLAMQESSGQARPGAEAGHTGTAGLFQFEAGDLARHGQAGKSVTDPMAQIAAMNDVFSKIPQGSGIGDRKTGGAAYFGPLRDTGVNRGAIAKHEREAAAVVARNPAPSGANSQANEQPSSSPSVGAAPSFAPSPSVGAAPSFAGDPRMSTVGNYRLGSDPRRAAILAAATEASKNLPPGWKAEAFSGERTGPGQGPHASGAAIDFRLIDPQGHQVPDYQDPKSFGTYEKFAQDSHLALQKINPQLAAQHRWGGYFSGGLGKGGTYGAMDLMHQDVAGGNARMAAGQWETGLSPKWRQAWGVTDANAGIGARAGQNAQADRGAIDARAVKTQKVEATGKLTANINAPKGTDVTLEGGGMFKKTETNRQTQMAEARRGPAPSSVQGAGTAL